MLASHGIANIVFTVRDIDRSEHFYRTTLGLNVERMPGDTGEPDWLIAHTAGGVDLIFFQGESQPGSSPILVFTLDTGGIDAMVADLADQGATIVTPVSHSPGGWSADFNDPDGHILSVYQEADQPR